MTVRAQLSVTDMRRATRHSVDYVALAEHRQLGEVSLRITNLSANGFMASGDIPLGRGERLTIRLPEVGRIEAFVIWKEETRAGFQFERILRDDIFLKAVCAARPARKSRFVSA